MSAAMDHARSMIASFRKGWESTGEPITREALRDHALFMAGIQRTIIAEEGEHPFSRAELEAYEQIAAEYAAPEDDGTEAESLAEVSVPKFPDVLVHGRAGAA
jgi:hypothetical protein